MPSDHGRWRHSILRLLQPVRTRWPISPVRQRFVSLGDTTRWQVFSGLKRTRGLSGQRHSGDHPQLQGGIVESLYAANSTISAEAHGHLGASHDRIGASTAGLPRVEIQRDPWRYPALARLRIDGN